MQNVYTVGQINSYIKNMFVQDFLLQDFLLQDYYRFFFFKFFSRRILYTKRAAKRFYIQKEAILC